MLATSIDKMPIAHIASFFHIFQKVVKTREYSIQSKESIKAEELPLS